MPREIHTSVDSQTFKELTSYGLACVSVHIGVNAETGKKTSDFVASWRSVTPETSLMYYEPSFNSVAVLTGSVSKIFVLDVDNNRDLKGNGMEAWDLMVFRNGDINTWKAKTGSGGLHVYFKMPDVEACPNLRNRISLFYDDRRWGIDVRAEGGVAFCPPSSYDVENGVRRRYEWINSPASCDLAPVPQWLLEILKADDHRQRAQIAYASFGDDDGWDSDLSSDLKEELTISEIVSFLRKHPKYPDHTSEFRDKVKDRDDLYAFKVTGPRVCIYGHSHRGSNNFCVRRQNRELYYICHGSECSSKERKFLGTLSMEAYLERSPGTKLTYTDKHVLSILNETWAVHQAFSGDCNHRTMARLLAETYRKCGRVVSCDDVFYVWQGDLWQKMSSASMRGLCCENLDHIIRAYSKRAPLPEPSEETTSKKKAKSRSKVLEKAIDKTGNSSFVDGTIKLLMPFLEHSDFMKSLNKNRDIFALRNGVLDLRTGSFHRHHPKYMCTFHADAEWRPTSSTVFADFVSDIFNGDQEVIDYIQMMFGYGITGHTSEQMFVILHGFGSNGKSVLLNAIKGALGKYYGNMHRDVILEGPKASRGAADPNMAILENTRLAVCEETGERNRLDDTIIKNISGETDVVTRNIYESTRSFTPTFQPILATNHKPQINVADPALLRRLVLIPFSNTYVPADRYKPEVFPNHRVLDTSLNRKLSTDSAKAEIVQWLATGAKRWYEKRANSVSVHGTERPALRTKPALLDSAMADYQNENDPVKQFVEENCELGISYAVRSSDILYRYKYVTMDDTMTPKAMAAALRRLGFDNNKNKPMYMQDTKETARGFKGLRLITLEQ